MPNARSGSLLGLYDRGFEYPIRSVLGHALHGLLSPLLLRVVGHLPQTDGAASSGGRCPTSLRGGNRGPTTPGGAAFYGESGIDPLGWIGRLGSTP